MTHSFDPDYWDQIWQSGRAASMGSSHTNPHLIREVAHLRPGTALEAGCGAGAEAIWLAHNGWQVTAADVSVDALAIAAERAASSGVPGQVQWVEADLSVWEPAAPYDLVTTHYAHPAMPQLEFYDRLASWVAPTGTLLIVGHLHLGSHSGGEPAPGHDHAEPPDAASTTADAITARLDPDHWEIVTAEETHRTIATPDGHRKSIHDVVVRATRQ